MWFDMAIPTFLFICFIWLISKVFSGTRQQSPEKIERFMKTMREYTEDQLKQQKERQEAERKKLLDMSKNIDRSAVYKEMERKRKEREEFWRRDLQVRLDAEKRRLGL